MADHDELIQQFTAISGADADRAKFFLEAAAWELTTALASFYEEPEEAADEPAASNASNSQASGPPVDRSPKKKIGTIGQFADVPEDSDKDSDSSSSEEEGQAFYAGGSRTSGQQIVGPGKKKDVVGKLMKAAKAQGAEVMLGESHQGRGGRQNFRGTSYRLGETSDAAQAIPDAHAAPSDEPVPITLRLYRDGFTVDDGDLRLYTEPQNMEFITQIKNGRIPLELLKISKSREVNLTMQDLREHKYEPPKKSLKTFSGAGHSLGSPTPTVVGQVPHVPGPGGSATAPPQDTAAREALAKTQLSVDAAQPTTNVQVRLNDGSRLVIHANQSHTVGDLRTYLNTARPQYEGANVALMTTFPHAELADPSKSLKEANILNSAIVVKYK